MCAAIAACAAICGCVAGASAQVHKVEKAQKVVRAVGVYEWVGEMAKPNASRLIPVSLFIDGKFEDAGIYEARPVPFALDTGNVYEVQKAGIAQGTVDIAFARRLVPTANVYTTWDDGWFGYGKFFPPAPPKKSNLKPMTRLAKINGIDDESDDTPHFSARSATPGSGGAATPLPGAATAASSVPADDPDRPVLHRGSGDKASSDSDVPDDPDRPTLRKHATPPAGTPTENPDVSAIGGPMADKDRPELHRGKPAGEFTEADLPKLTGLPKDIDLQQMVAVSDAADRPAHNFSRAWSDDAERATILSTMQDAARAALTAYEKANGLEPINTGASAGTGGAAAAGKSGGTKSAAATPAARRAAAKKVTAAPPPPEPLVNEKLTGYTLSYGGSPTFVYSAQTDGSGAGQRFVTVVAQENVQGQPEIVLKNVTDQEHLDRTPRLKLVDAVDADASNRASLLFELREQGTRQFALYRVLGGRADQIFLSGAVE